jgi:methylated-DNA-[protein]-cysteine S-methyltransferase
MLIDTPIGKLLLEMKENKIIRLNFATSKEENFNNQSTEIKKWLDDYFAMKNPINNFELMPQGTNFQLKVWQELLKIKYGKTTTYSEIATKIGSSPRAVGQAIKRNPIIILIPCHRVVGKNSLGGFLGKSKIDIKKQLLELENGN